MPTEKAIKKTYLKLHNDLSEIYYDDTMGLLKEDFDTQHSLVWDAMTDELIAEGYLSVPIPGRDLEAEFDELKSKVEALEKK